MSKLEQALSAPTVDAAMMVLRDALNIKGTWLSMETFLAADNLTLQPQLRVVA